jgi:hypothetical protein
MRSWAPELKLGRWLAAAVLVFVSVIGAAHHHDSLVNSGNHDPATDAPCAVCAALHAPAHLVVAASVVVPERAVVVISESSFLSPTLDRIGELPARSPPQAS